MAPLSNPCAAEIAAHIAALTGVAVADLKIDQPPRVELGDFAIAMFPAAKLTKEAPPAVAARVARDLPRGGLIAEATATGPFVNVKVDRAAAIALAIDAASGKRRLVPDLGEGGVVCIDYSSPNISKHLAYHHIRSTMLGHALVKMHEALGYRVVRINHLGDWGTTHGMLLAAYQRWGQGAAVDVTRLNELYVQYREAMKTDESLAGEARTWFKRLEDGEPAARAQWKTFRDVSLAEFEGAYRMLGVAFDDVNGESFYEDKMAEVLDLIASQDRSSESEGALVMQLPGEKTPLLLKTTDGTTLYATRDLAAALYRWRTYHFTRSLYVVDRGQSLHFRQLFAALGLLGFEWAARCQHVPFGLVRFGGKKTSTRAGAVLLKEVFREATDQVRAVIREHNADMPEAQLDATAELVGVGAVVFANVLPQRDRDIDFELDKVLSLQGDSGPYLHYNVARCYSIERKAGVAATGTPDLGRLTHDAEWAVARRLLDFGDHVARAAAGCEPHIVAHYLLELAGAFAYWYTLGSGDPALRILCDDEPTRVARLALMRALRETLIAGMALLGLTAVEVM